MDAKEREEIEAKAQQLRDEGHRVQLVYVYRDIGYDVMTDTCPNRLEGIEVHHYPLNCRQCKVAL